MPANVKKSYFTSNSAISPDPEYNAASVENILLQIIQPNSSRRILHLNILIEISRMFKCKTNFFPLKTTELFVVYDRVSDVVENGVSFASKILTHNRMH